MDDKAVDKQVDQETPNALPWQKSLFRGINLVLFIIGIAGMCVMGYLGRHMDTSARSNWIEEAVNTVSQLAILIGLLML